MRKKIKKIIIILLLMAALTGGFFKIKEYRAIKAEQEYGECTIECDKKSRNSRGNLESDQNGKKDKSALAAIVLEYESCLDVCCEDYKKITGEEITPVYETLKEKWNLDVSP